MTVKRKTESGPAARSPKKKAKSNSSRAPSSTKSTSNPPRKSANLLGNRGFKLRDPKNPLAGTVVDDILPSVDDQHGGIRERERREEDSDKENATISLDDDDRSTGSAIYSPVVYCLPFES